MPKINAIQVKALFMLVTFTASFTVFCHCAKAAAAAAATCCCKKMATGRKAGQKDNRSCQGMQAVKLNLQEKQTADNILVAPAPLTALPVSPEPPGLILRRTENRQPQQWAYKHSPPDRLSLFQCFLI